MARFYTYAEVLTPEHIQAQAHARGLGCGREPGLVLQEVLDRNGGRYQATMPLPDSIREQARICAQLSGDPEIARIAGLSEVTISLEHLRGLDPGTRIVCGYGLGDFTDAERGQLPRDQGPVDPATIIEGPVDPANPRRIVRRPASCLSAQARSTAPRAMAHSRAALQAMRSDTAALSAGALSATSKETPAARPAAPKPRR